MDAITLADAGQNAALLTEKDANCVSGSSVTPGCPQEGQQKGPQKGPQKGTELFEDAVVSLSNAILSLEPSPTLSASQRANELKALGKDIISLTVGEPDFETPQHIKDAAADAMKKGYTRYTAVAGILPLRHAISEKLQRDQHLVFPPSQVVVTNGGKQALAAACAVLLNPGDEAVIPAPYWTSYPDMVKLTGAKPVIVHGRAENGYVLTGEELLKACTPRTKVIFLNTPSNPTGACYTEAQLQDWRKALSTLKNKDQIVILSDEVYEYITYDDFKHVSFATIAPEFRENTLVVNAFSKTYAMTGWRVGYVAGPKHIISAIETHQSQFTSNVCSIAQYAAAKAYEDGGAFPKQMQEEFSRRLDFLCEAAANIKGVRLVRPKGAFYGFFEIDQLLGKRAGSVTIDSGLALTRYLLEEFDVAVVQGEAFGAPAAFRISFALGTSALSRALQRITDAIAKLK